MSRPFLDFDFEPSLPLKREKRLGIFAFRAVSDSQKWNESRDIRTEDSRGGGQEKRRQLGFAAGSQ